MSEELNFKNIPWGQVQIRFRNAY